MTRIRQRPPKIKRARGQVVEQAISRVITASTADREIPAKKLKVKDLPGSRTDDVDDDDAVIPEHLTNEEMEKQVAFCCYRCFCPKTEKDRIDVKDPFIQEGEARLYHRRCCHKVYRQDRNWMSPFQKASEKIDVEGGKEPPEEMTDHDLRAQYENAIRHENALYNSDTLPDYGSLLQTCDEYVENINRFNAIKAEKSNDGAMVVLDMFAGMGSAIVALKRLGISMKKIIHVEHDHVANHVYKWNHDATYNQELPQNDPIEHVYVEKFEKFENDQYLQEFLDTHGPVDFVVGGPPCVDYSGANAHRQGVDGEQGSYMPRFGSLIQKIQQSQPNHHVFYLAENTILRNDREMNLDEGDLETIKKSFGVQWSMDIDAQYFTPGRRNRTYISNIPLFIRDGDSILDEELVDALYLPVSEGFAHPAHLCCDILKYDRMVVKVPCFMASKDKIDTPTMAVVKISKDDNGDKFIEKRYLNLTERETVMGFPIGYVEAAVRDLFDKLLEHGYGNTLQSQTYWKRGLPEKYHLFGGLPARLDTSTYQLIAELQPPKVNSANDFFDQTQYGKRLIGNAFSVPVIEIILRELKTKFPEREYKGYTYQYVWQAKRVAVKHEDEMQT